MSTATQQNFEQAVQRALYGVFTELDCDTQGIFLESTESIRGIMTLGKSWGVEVYPIVVRAIEGVCRPSPVKLDADWFRDGGMAQRYLEWKGSPEIFEKIEDWVSSINDFAQKYEEAVGRPQMSAFAMGQEVGRVILDSLEFHLEGLYTLRPIKVRTTTLAENQIDQIAQDVVDHFTLANQGCLMSDHDENEIRTAIQYAAVMALDDPSASKTRFSSGDKIMFMNGFFELGVFGFSERAKALFESSHIWHAFREEMSQPA